MNQVNFSVMIICGESWHKIIAFNVNIFQNKKALKLVSYFIDCNSEGRGSGLVDMPCP